MTLTILGVASSNLILVAQQSVEAAAGEGVGAVAIEAGGAAVKGRGACRRVVAGDGSGGGREEA